MLSARKMLERVTLGVGLVGAIVVAVGLGYKLGDYALGLIREARPAKTDVVPKPPMLVKEETKTKTVTSQEETSFIRVLVAIGKGQTAEKISERLSSLGYESYKLPGEEAIQVGAFKDKDKAAALSETLEKAGLTAKLD